MMKFALIGNGFIAPKHIEAIKSVGGELVAVCDIDPKKKIKGIPFFTDYREAIKKVEAVSICTPNHLHPEMILDCVGKKILCEKPISFKLKDFSWLNKVPDLFGNFQLRYLPNLNEIRQTSKGAEQVDLVVEMKRSKTYHQSWKGDPIKSGGLLVNIGCHYFDLVGHLFGYSGFKSEVFKLDDLLGLGRLTYPNLVVNWRICFVDEKDSYERTITIDRKRFDLVQGSNLHIRTYEDFMWGHGVRPEEEEKIMKMLYEILQ